MSKTASITFIVLLTAVVSCSNLAGRILAGSPKAKCPISSDFLHDLDTSGPTIIEELKAILKDLGTLDTQKPLEETLFSFFKGSLAGLIEVKAVSEGELISEIKDLVDDHFSSEHAEDFEKLFEKIYQLVAKFSLYSVSLGGVLNSRFFDLPNDNAQAKAHSFEDVAKGKAFTENYTLAKTKYSEKFLGKFKEQVDSFFTTVNVCLKKLLRTIEKEDEKLSAFDIGAESDLDRNSQNHATALFFVASITNLEVFESKLGYYIASYSDAASDDESEHPLFEKFIFKAITKLINKLLAHKNENYAVIASKLFLTSYSSILLRRGNDEGMESYVAFVKAALGSRTDLLEDENPNKRKFDLITLMEAFSVEHELDEQVLERVPHHIKEFIMIDRNLISAFDKCSTLFDGLAFTFNSQLDEKLAKEAHDFFLRSLIEKNPPNTINDIAWAFDQSINESSLPADMKFYFKIFNGFFIMPISRDISGLITFPQGISEATIDRLKSGWFQFARKSYLKFITKLDQGVDATVFRKAVTVEHEEIQIKNKIFEDKSFTLESPVVKVEASNRRIEFKAHTLSATQFRMEKHCEIKQNPFEKEVPITQTILKDEYLCEEKEESVPCSQESFDSKHRECIEKYNVRKNIVKVVKGGVDEKVIETLKNSPDMMDYITNEAVINEKIDGVDYEFVFVQVDNKKHPCYGKNIR